MYLGMDIPPRGHRRTAIVDLTPETRKLAAAPGYGGGHDGTVTASIRPRAGDGDETTAPAQEVPLLPDADAWVGSRPPLEPGPRCGALAFSPVATDPELGLKSKSTDVGVGSGTPVASNLADDRRLGYRRVKVRWVTPLGDETASTS
jgi:hypothetical protein